MNWTQGLTVAAISGACTFVGSCASRIWIDPHLPASASGIRPSLKTVGISVIGIAAGSLYARLPLWWLLPMAAGVMVGTLLPHAVIRRTPRTDSRS